MPDPVTTVGLGAIAAYLGKDGVAKILGPTADYLGGELQAFTQKRIESVGKIFSSAEKKLGDKIEVAGQVPPKVLKTIINEGSYTNDDLAIEYFGGVLASSRTEIGRDDRGARMVRILDNMSSYQIRAHYLVYSTISNLFKDKGEKLGTSQDRIKLQLFLPMAGFYQSMEFNLQEQRDPQLMSHIWHGLSNDGLIENHWMFGNKSDLKSMFKDCPGAGIVCQPSSVGAELYLWALGKADMPIDYLLSSRIDTTIDGAPNAVQGSLPTKT